MNKISYVKPEEISSVKNLMDEIRDGSADVGDFREYEKFLINHGIDKAMITQPLEKAHINGWPDLVSKRNKLAHSPNYAKRNEMESLVIAVLLGLGLYLLLRELSKTTT